MKFWINGLRGDFHPSSEIRIWERVASCFVEYSSMTELSAKQHRALFDIVVALSCGCQVGELGEKMKILPKDAADKIMLLWKYPVPPFDIKNDDFPMHYRLSPKDEERFKQVDAETFPNDVPNELIERIFSGKSVDSPRVNNKSASKKGGSK